MTLTESEYAILESAVAAGDRTNVLASHNREMDRILSEQRSYVARVEADNARVEQQRSRPRSGSGNH